jgi:hypothetical protein
MVVISGALALITAQQLSAIMLVDRGLPTANLNNAAGVDRSNVDWGSTTGISLVGDTFMNTSSNTWNISSIRLWTDGVAENPPGQPVPILWGGVDAGPISVVASSGALTSTSYLGGQGYQASGGSFYQLFQIDFAVSISLAPGQTYSFFLDGFDPSYPPYIFAEASNALLSGSLQQQADGLMLQADVHGNVLGNVQTWTSDSNVSSVSPNGGWDKSSDVNVQVFGSVPDGGTTLVLLGGALTGLGALRRKFRR